MLQPPSEPAGLLSGIAAFVRDWQPVFELIKTGAALATIAISLVNAYLVYRFFYYKDRKEDQVKQRDIRITWFKGLVLDYNLQNFYDFYDNLEVHLNQLKGSACNLETKQEIEKMIRREQGVLRRKFVDSLLAVDGRMHHSVLNVTDTLVDQLANDLFDEGINLNIPAKFEERIMEPISRNRTEVLTELFNYDGSGKSTLLIKQ